MLFVAKLAEEAIFTLAILKAAMKLVASVITITLLSILVYILYKFVVSGCCLEQQ
jgi:hypothetical protein